MRHAPTSPALVTAAAELLLLRCTDGPVPLGEAVGASAAWLALGLVAARLDRRLAALPVVLWAVMLPIWRDGGPADASLAAWAAAAALLGLGLLAAARGPVAWTALLATSTLVTVAATPATLPTALAVAVALGAALTLPLLRPTAAWVVALTLSQAPRDLYDPRPVRWSAEARAEGPDILLVVVDTLRGDAGRATRSYARLAEDGRAFPHATASGPWTLPSLGSLLTALPFHAHGAGARPDGPPTALAPVPTVAERLTDAGYDTAAVVAPNPWLCRAYGFDRGFAVWEHLAEPHPAALPANPAVSGAHPLPVLALHTARGLLGRPAASSAEPLVDRALEILAARRDRPVFLWLHLLDPHLPWTGLPGVGVAALRDDPAWHTPEGLDRARTAYLRDVDRADRAVERLLDALGPPPPHGRLVIFTSDHGEELLEHGGYEHGHTLYQELLDVPLVLAGEGVVPGTETAAVGLDQLGATILAAAGLPSPVDLRRPAPALPVVSGNLLSGDPGAGLAVRLGDDKRVHLPDVHARYDLGRDPGERHPLPVPAESTPLVTGPAAAPIPPRLLEALGYLDR